MKNKDKIMDDQAKRIEAHKALYFLREHPAVNNDVMGDSLFDGAWFHMSKCCKRGKDEHCKRSMTIHRGEKGWRRFKDRFDKELEDGESKSLQSIYLTYEEWYGEPWVFDHVEYWYETTYFAFSGNPFHKSEYMDYKNWNRYGGPEGGANTFEDMLIKCARQVRKAFGSFDHEDKRLYLPEELANNKAQRMFHNLKFENGSRLSCPLKRNAEYIDVNEGLINLRWLKWFVETDYCKKNWDSNMGEFRGFIKKSEQVPKSRQKILDRYK